MVKSHLPMQETWVRSLGQEDPLEKEIATHSSVLAREILWTEEPRLQSMGSQKNQTGLSDQTISDIYQTLHQSLWDMYSIQEAMAS